MTARPAFRIAWVACAAVVGMTGSAAAQDAGAEASGSGVVVKIHGVSVTPGTPQESPLHQFFGLLVEYAKPLVGWGVVDREEFGELLKDLQDDLTPQSSAIEYVVSATGGASPGDGPLYVRTECARTWMQCPKK